MKVVSNPIESAELLDKLDSAHGRLVREIGEPEALLEAMYLAAALRLTLTKRKA